MDDAVHVEVEIVEFDAVRVRSGGIHRKGEAIGADSRLLLDHVHYRERVAVREPPIERRHSHDFPSLPFPFLPTALLD